MLIRHTNFYDTCRTLVFNMVGLVAFNPSAVQCPIHCCTPGLSQFGSFLVCNPLHLRIHFQQALEDLDIIPWS